MIKFIVKMKLMLQIFLYQCLNARERAKIECLRKKNDKYKIALGRHVTEEDHRDEDKRIFR